MNIKTLALSAAVVFLVGCVNTKYLPAKMRDIALPNMGHPLGDSTPATQILDCIDDAFGSLRDIWQASISEASNKIGAKSKLAIPDDLSDYIEVALGRMHGRIGFVDYSAIEAEAATAEILFRGSVLAAESVQSTEADADFFGVGSSAQGRVYRITITLRVTNAILGNYNPPIKISVALFERSIGASIFVITDGDFARGRVEKVVRQPVDYALQYAFEYATARVVARLLEETYQISTVQCFKTVDNWTPDFGKNKDLTAFTITSEREYIDTQPALCVATKAIRGLPFNTPVSLRVLAQRDHSFPVLHRTWSATADDLSDASFCLDDFIYQKNHSLTIVIEDQAGQVLGSHYISQIGS